MSRKEQIMLKNLIERVEWNLRAGMNPQDAVDDVAEKIGLSKDGNVYEYLLKRAKEEGRTS